MNKQVLTRLNWAEEDVNATQDKLLTLFASHSFSQREWLLWEEITKHIADSRSHIQNARNFASHDEETE